MRTTIEITDEQRARLLEIAASRGEKGFSSLVREALDLYLQRELQRAERVQAARGMKGYLNEHEGESLRQRCRDVRERWR